MPNRGSYPAGMANLILNYGSQTYVVECPTDADEKKFIKTFRGTLAIGGLLEVPTSEGVRYLGFPTGVEIVLTPSR